MRRILAGFLLIFAVLISCDLDSSSVASEVEKPGPELEPIFGIMPQQSSGLVTSGEDAKAYFVTVGPNEKISINLSGECDIWYLYTNSTSKDIHKDTALSNNFITLPIKNVKTTKRLVSKRGIDKPIVFSQCPITQIRAQNDEDELYKGKYFYDHSLAEPRKLRAICQYIADVDTDLGPRRLVIYVEDDLLHSDGSAAAGMPEYEDYIAMAGLFLKEGPDNDIFDKMTGMFGCDWGYYNSSYEDGKERKKLIEKNDTITILFCNIGNAGLPKDDESYIAGYYYDGDLLRTEYAPKTNARAMITIHAPAAVGKRIGDTMSTLAHEFQHLIHSQYYNNKFTNNPDDYRPDDMKNEIEESNAITECFSSAAESYISDWISQNTQKSVPGPFCAGVGIGDKGYLSGEDSDYFEKGRGPFFLQGMDKGNLMTWSCKDYYTQEEIGEDPVLLDYGLVASFANYLLVNYGTQIFKVYTLSKKANMAGIVEAINKCYTEAKITQSELIRNWGISVMLSSLPNLKSPYSMNRKGWYILNSNMRVPSVNMWLYRVNGTESFGFQSSNFGSYYKGYSNTPVLVSSQKEGVFNATAPDFDPALNLTVLAIPRN